MSGRRRGVRGKHRSPRRPLSAALTEWEAWDRAASRVWPFTFAEWARRTLNAAASAELAADTRADTRARAPKRELNAHARELAGLTSSHRGRKLRAR